MPRQDVVTRTLYKFEELSDKAKEKARDWWRECESESFGDHAFQTWHEDWENIATILGIEFKRHKVVPMGGEKYARMEPNIYWSLHTQGSGVAFEGTYRYKKGGHWKALKKYAPQDVELAEIAANLDNMQKRFNYRLSANITHSGNYTHEYSCDIEVTRTAPNGNELMMTADDAKEFSESFISFMRWMHTYLNNEWSHAMDQETVDENIACNDYEFTEEGRIA